MLPIGIRIGRVPLGTPTPASGGFPASNWDVFDVALIPVPPGTVGTGPPQYQGTFAWDDGSPDLTTNPYTVEQKLFRRYFSQGDVGYELDTPPLLPVALYRQQIGWGTVASYTPVPNADVVQVSPLITRIESTVRTGQGAAADRRFRVLTDPFVNAVITHEPAGTFNPVFADLCLFDTTPVTVGAVYSYYLVHFDSRFAIDFMINAGTVAITGG